MLGLVILGSFGLSTVSSAKLFLWLVSHSFCSLNAFSDAAREERDRGRSQAETLAHDKVGSFLAIASEIDVADACCREFDLEEDYRKTMKKLDPENHELSIVRIPRPPDETAE